MSNIVKMPWLIQRCKLNGKTEQPGFDSKFRLDYMGSSEFEVGSIPASLKFMCKNSVKLSVHKLAHIINYKSQYMHMICTDEIYEQYKIFIPSMIKDEIQLKEASYLKENTTGIWFGKPIDDSFSKVDMWWDILNNVMLCYGQSTAELIMASIKEVVVKKKVAGCNDWVPVQ